MKQFTLIEFLAASIPESLVIAIFAWVILGKKDSVKFYNVIIAGLLSGASLAPIYVLLYPYTDVSVLLQIIAFALIILFVFRINFIEAIVGSLFSTISVTITQIVIISIGYFITGLNLKDIPNNLFLKFTYAYIEIAVVGIVSYIMYRKNIKIFSFKPVNKGESYSSKIRYLVLQITFAILIIINNSKIFYFNIASFKTNMDKVLLFFNFFVIFTFTVLVIMSALKMSQIIQKEEEEKRKLDNKEIIQNIDYLCKLMDLKRYEEVNNILKSIKNDVDYNSEKSSNRIS
jgi:hypothetical protein